MEKLIDDLLTDLSLDIGLEKTDERSINILSSKTYFRLKNRYNLSYIMY